MMRIEDDRLFAFVDGEIDESERRLIEQAAASDAELRARIEAQRALRAQIALHYAPVIDEPVPRRLSALLDDRVVNLSQAREKRPVRNWQMLTAMAATLMLGLFAGYWLSSNPPAQQGEELIARGSLAHALDTQLASTQAMTAPTRIGVSFTSRDGRLCRTFVSTTLDGIACRTGSDWQLMATVPGSARPEGEYRQAGSMSALILQTAQEMMAGEPLDEADERRARDANWNAQADRQ